MQGKTFKIRLGLTLAVLTAALGIAASAPARIPVEPGDGSPVTHQHGRLPANTKATRRNFGGYPGFAGKHVRSDAETRTE